MFQIIIINLLLTLPILVLAGVDVLSKNLFAMVDPSRKPSVTTSHVTAGQVKLMAVKYRNKSPWGVSISANPLRIHEPAESVRYFG